MCKNPLRREYWWKRTHNPKWNNTLRPPHEMMMMSLLCCLELKQSWWGGEKNYIENFCTPLSISSSQERCIFCFLQKIERRLLCSLSQMSPFTSSHIAYVYKFSKEAIILSKQRILLDLSVNYHHQHVYWFHFLWSKKGAGLEFCSLFTAIQQKRKGRRDILCAFNIKTTLCRRFSLKTDSM